MAAIEFEGVRYLPQDARRRCVHYTHVRTFNPEHKQPAYFSSRAAMWDHVARCYEEAYPDENPASLTGSILQFGLVAREYHHESVIQAERDMHHHVATLSDVPHYWRRVQQLSFHKYRVLLNAVAHDGRCSTYPSKHSS